MYIAEKGVPPIPWYSGFNFFSCLARWVLYIQFNFQRGSLYSIQFPEGIRVTFGLKLNTRWIQFPEENGSILAYITLEIELNIEVYLWKLNLGGVFNFRPNVTLIPSGN